MHLSDGRVQKVGAADFTYIGHICKFEWIKGVKYYFSFLTKDLYIGRLLKNQDPERKTKVYVNKQVRDYGLTVSLNKTIVATLVDSNGRIYRGVVDHNHSNSIDFSDKIIDLDYKNEDKIVSICSYSCFVICSTSKGNLILLYFDDSHNLMVPPTTFIVIDKLKTQNMVE